MNNSVDKKALRKGILPYLVIAVVMLGLFYILTVMNKDIKVLTYDEFIEKLDKNKITEMEVVARSSGFVYEFSNKDQEEMLKLINELNFDNTTTDKAPT